MHICRQDRQSSTYIGAHKEGRELSATTRSWTTGSPPCPSPSPLTLLQQTAVSAPQTAVTATGKCEICCMYTREAEV